MTSTSYRALLVGVPRYDDDHIDNLEFIESDLAELGDALSHVGYAVEAHDPSASDRSRIKRGIEQFLLRAGSGQQVLIVLSGHGVHREGKDYLVPSSAWSGARDFSEECVEINFDRYIEASDCGDVIVVVDACREGIHLQEKAAATTISWSKRRVERTANRSVVYVYACGNGERAGYVDGDDAFSVFTRAMSQTLQGRPPADLTKFLNAVQHVVGDLERETQLRGRQHYRVRGEPAPGRVLRFFGDESADFDPTYYLTTFIRNYENFEAIRTRRDTPIVEPIARENLFSVYVPMECNDGRGHTRELDAYVQDWLASDGEGPLVILGEYGYGKTSYCLNLTYRLLQDRQQGNVDGYFPIFLSFRDLVPSEERRSAATTGETVLDILRDRYRLIDDDSSFPAVFAQRRMLLILDGLDEIERSLKVEWIRHQFRSVSDITRHFAKVIVTCRVGYLSGNDEVRHVMSREQYQQIVGTVTPGDEPDIVTLQPFDLRQKMRYVELAVADPLERRQLLDAIERIDDLPDLTTRPVLLWMVVRAFRERIIDLESLREFGAAQLYERFTRQWLEFELDKDHIGRDVLENQELMHRLALKIGQSPTEQIQRNELIQELKISFPGKTSAEIDRLEHQFLVCSFFRPSQVTHFAFVHRSFLEFFVARAYYGYIKDERADAFGHNRLKPGLVTQFLCQLIKSERAEFVVNRLAQWLVNARTLVQGESRLAANAATVLCALNFRFQGLDLSGADLRDADLSGGDLRQVVLRGAQLDNALLDNTRLAYSDLTNADMSNVFIRSTDFQGADLRGARLKNPRMIGGPDTIWIALYSRDDEHIVIGTDRGDLVMLENRPPYREVARQHVHDRGVMNVAFSPDGTRLAVTNRQREIYVYDWPSLVGGQTEPPVVFADNANYVRWVEFSPDGTRLASGARDLMVKVWFLGDEPQVINLKFHNRDVMCVAWSPDGRWLASAGYDATIALWDATNDSPTPIDLRDPKLMTNRSRVTSTDKHSHGGAIRALVFSPDGTLLASSSEDDTIKLWNVSDPLYPMLDATIPTEHDVFCIAFLDDGATLVVGDSAGDMLKIDLVELAVQHTVRAHGNRIRSIDLNHDRTVLLSSSWDGWVKTWNTSDLSLIETVYQLDTGDAVYHPPDGFLDTNVGGVRDLEDLYRQYFIALGARETEYGSTTAKPAQTREAVMSTPEVATDALFTTSRAMARESIRVALTDTIRQPWHDEVFCRLQPGSVPGDYPFFGTLLEAGVIHDDGTALYRLNNVHDMPFLTDGLWRRDGVFPFTDESMLLLTYCLERRFENFDAVVDPGSGCGHTAIAFPGHVERNSFDMDDRAVAFVQLNAWINDRETTAVRNDITRGLPPSIEPISGRRYLFTANMPFAISPYAGALSHIRDGGESGIRLSVAVLEAVRPFIGTRSKLVILTYSLGRSEDWTWQFVERARQILPECEQRWVLTDGRIWRVGIDKVEPNPMPLSSLKKKASSPARTLEENHRLREGYDKLAKELSSLGWDTLGCGILEVTL